MKKSWDIVLISAGIILFYLIPGYALEQGEPVNGLSLEGITFFEFDTDKKTDSKKFELKLPVAMETQGLWGPLGQENPVAAYFWERYKESGMKREIEYNPNAEKQFKTPFIRLTAMQSPGTPVKIKLLAPAPHEITMPLSGAGRAGRNIRYQVIKRICNFRVLSSEGDVFLDKSKEKISLVEDKDAMEISWTPSRVEDKYGSKLKAPVVLEINLLYNVKREMIVDGKVHDAWSRKEWIERRVAWLALPVCGQEFGEDDEPIACPGSIHPGSSWKEYTLGPVSLQVPDTWDSKIRNESGRFELGNGLAGINVVRETGGEKQLTFMTEVTERKIKISGLDAVEYSGRVKDGKVRARLILFEDTPSDSKVMGIATILKDEKYREILDASLNSVKIDSGKSDPPDRSAAPISNLPELSDLGKGAYSYSPNNIPQKEYAKAEPAVQAPQTGAVVSVGSVPPDNTVGTGQAATARASLKLRKVKGASDFVGRNEVFQGNGSPDSQLKLEIEVPDRTITSLVLRQADTQKPVWDTIPDNKTWLMAVTQKNKAINRTDGSLQYTPGKGKEKLVLWLQDNHMIAAGKQELELVISFDNNESLIIPMER
ncbi:hypothetical protein HRM2_08280 [Desulforapulum autotrophicum HRM2]|uniref:Uncharacterized protein n=1 Tax=Desulforapulum autotrophicum (strain ATCC 43914 / DSM 3382 / VKM B-1955 / HRM2) TaxID=177437 RepID=C0QJT8_DESAH|nr:hypothetical protein [Desulforapulum autotrophicum]ACN13941.1 hypothetical protein HRM2_08280 [Desulforapulum autotrophicum HRM2]